VRQDARSDAGGAGRELNDITASLMSAIDQYRSIDGFIVMAATNRLDGLDEALIREERFDLKIRLDLSGRSSREQASWRRS
jgi:ATP-dependent Zn protease